MNAAVGLAAAAGDLHVVFKVAGSEYAIHAREVVQIDAYSGVTPVPGALPYVAGVVQVRGRVMPVLDTRARFGLPRIEPTLETRLVVGKAGERIVALLVDGAREVIKLAPDQLKPPPRLVTEQAQGFVKAVAQVGPRLLLLVDLGRLIGEANSDGGR